MAVARIQLGSILGAARCCLNNRSHSRCARVSAGQLVTAAHKRGAMSTRYVGVFCAHCSKFIVLHTYEVIHPERYESLPEVESGKKNDRPELIKALALCRVHKATLLIAKLDRLARNVAFISNLMESGVEFTAVDFPQANRLTIHVLAAVAEYEALAISARTKSALAVAKANGKRWVSA